MRCCRCDRPGLLFVLLLSTLMCCQPTELIWAFFCFINFPIILPPPQAQIKQERRRTKAFVRRDERERTQVYTSEQVGDGVMGEHG